VKLYLRKQLTADYHFDLSLNTQTGKVKIKVMIVIA